MIPAYADQLATIPHDRKSGLIAWLRSLGKDQASVRLDWHKRGQFTLSHRDANGHSAPPCRAAHRDPRQTAVITFNARYLADALEIGSTLCLSDELSPGSLFLEGHLLSGHPVMHPLGPDKQATQWLGADPGFQFSGTNSTAPLGTIGSACSSCARASGVMGQPMAGRPARVPSARCT